MEAGAVLIDRYEVVRELGRGGAGELLLVRDRKQDRAHCALKVLKPRAHDPGLAPLFRSEFLLLSDVNHPSIVGVRDFGALESGESYFTMDYLPGENCRPFVQADRLDAHEYVELAAGLLSALAHIHACGIVHRDVKPENVIMRRGDGHLVPCLIDFGLAVLSAASRSGEATGTLPYIAPEVLAGGAADPRSDLFSLGMLLYEVCTGEPPASRRELLSEPGRVLARDRVRRQLAKTARGSVPRRFEDFVCRLTVPTPAGRLGSAVASLKVLREMFGEETVGAPIDVAVRPIVSEAPLVGRGSALAATMMRVEALQEGTLLDPIVVVAGAEGAGVTRLLATVRNHASVSGCRVYSGAGLAELVDDVAPGARGDTAPEGMVFRADAALHALPLTDWPLLILDDVHRMSEAECAALRNWITALESRQGRTRLLLLLGGRNDGAGPGAQLLQTAGRNVPVELRELAPLEAADVRAALAAMTGNPDVPPQVVQSLHRASAGNARLLNELLGLLEQEGVLDLSGEEPELRAERLAKMRLPKGVIDAARRRLKSLPKGDRDALARFACVGRPLSHAAAAALAGDRLAGLMDSRHLVRDMGRVDFPHESARAAADTLAGDARTAAMREMAEALAEQAPVVAATLWSEIDELERAREVGVPACRELMRTGRVEEAGELLERITGEHPDPEAGRLLLRARYLGGRPDAAARLGRVLLEQETDVDVLMTTVSALRDSGQVERALELVSGYEGELTGLTGARIVNARASLLANLGRDGEALEVSRKAEELHGSLIDERGVLARARTNIFRQTGKRKSARRIEEQLIEAGDAIHATSRTAALSNRALMAIQFDGQSLEGLRLARAALRAGDRRPWVDGRTYSIIAMTLLAAGRPVRAAQLFARSKEYFERASRQGEFARALHNEALALLAAGRPAEADARLERHDTLPGAIEESHDRPSARAERAYLSGHPEEALELCKQHKKAGDEPGELAVQAARITAAIGDLDATEEAWRTALRHAWQERRRDLIARVRVGLAECQGRRGAWRVAERTLDRCRSDLLECRTSLRARAQVVRAAAALHKQEPAAAGRRIEEAVAIANRTDDVPLIADVYRAAASLLEEGGMQRFLRQPTGEASAALLEVARDAWTIYGNETMLRKIDLHLSELPRTASGAGEGSDDERLVKVLHIAREMNQEFDLDRLLQLILDRAIELTGAERGFVILLREGKADVHIARNIDREALSEPEHKLSSQIVSEVLSSGRVVRSEDAEAEFEEFLSVRQMHLKSVVAVPFRSSGRTIGALYLDNRFRTGNFGAQEERLLGLFADQATAAIDKSELIRVTEARKQELEELYKKQKAELKQRGRELRSAHKEIKRHRRARGYGFDKIIGRSVAMQAVLRESRRVADSDLSVLLMGENGTGKEMLAMAMHYESRRQGMPCLSINCAGYPGTLEAELFGHVRGAAGETDLDRAGMFEEADGGTLFLDEISELDPGLQVRLLRAIEGGEVRRVGESQARTVDVRVIAASTADLEEMVRNGRFREDLYYRLSGFVLRMPPLRDRLEDVEPLSYAFVAEAARREGRPKLEISNDAIARLESYTWSGNVRELRSVLFRAVVTAEEDLIGPDDVSFEARSPTLLPGFDPSQADRVVGEFISRGMDLNERQQTAIARVLTRGKLAFGEYQRLFHVSKSTTARDLEALLDMELLEKRGKTRAVVYLPGPKLREVAKKFGRG